MGCILCQFLLLLVAIFPIEPQDFCPKAKLIHLTKESRNREPGQGRTSASTSPQGIESAAQKQHVLATKGCFFPLPSEFPVCLPHALFQYTRKSDGDQHHQALTQQILKSNDALVAHEVTLEKVCHPCSHI